MHTVLVIIAAFLILYLAYTSETACVLWILSDDDVYDTCAVALDLAKLMLVEEFVQLLCAMVQE